MQETQIGRQRFLSGWNSNITNCSKKQNALPKTQKTVVSMKRRQNDGSNLSGSVINTNHHQTH